MASSSSSNVGSGGGFTCCVPDCWNNSKRTMGKLSFYVFPKDPNLREKWLRNMSMEDFVPTCGHRVCSEHFEGGTKTYLNNVPTKFPHKEPHEAVVDQVVQVEQAMHRQEEARIDNEERKAITEASQLQVVSVDSVEELKAKISELEKRNCLTLRNKLQSVDKFGVERYAFSDSDILFYTGFTNYAQFKALYVFLDGDGGVCSRLNYWGSN